MKKRYLNACKCIAVWNNHKVLVSRRNQFTLFSNICYEDNDDDDNGKEEGNKKRVEPQQMTVMDVSMHKPQPTRMHQNNCQLRWKHQNDTAFSFFWLWDLKLHLFASSRRIPFISLLFSTRNAKYLWKQLVSVFCVVTLNNNTSRWLLRDY